MAIANSNSLLINRDAGKCREICYSDASYHWARFIAVDLSLWVMAFRRKGKNADIGPDIENHSWSEIEAGKPILVIQQNIKNVKYACLPNRRR